MASLAVMTSPLLSEQKIHPDLNMDTLGPDPETSVHSLPVNVLTAAAAASVIKEQQKPVFFCFDDKLAPPEMKNT